MMTAVASRVWSQRLYLSLGPDTRVHRQSAVKWVVLPSPQMCTETLLWALLSCRGHVSVIEAQRWQLKPARTESELEQLEAAYRILDLYIWLSFRMEAAFTGMR